MDAETLQRASITLRKRYPDDAEFRAAMDRLLALADDDADDQPDDTEEGDHEAE